MWRTGLDYWTVVRIGRVAAEDRRGFVSHRRPRGTWHRDAERGGAGQRLCVDDVGRQRRSHGAIDDCRSGGCATAAFDIATTRVTTATVVTINAQAGGVRRTTALRLQIDPAGLTPTTSYTVGFSALRENKAAFTTHVESGFTVSAVAGDWMAITTYGNPQPFVEFYAPAGTTGTGEIRITAGGAPFWLNSVDFYSSTTKIP